MVSGPKQDGFWTPTQIAEYLSVSGATVRRLIVSGQLRAVDISVGKKPCYRVRSSHLEEYLASRQVLPAERSQVKQRYRSNVPDYLGL